MKDKKVDIKAFFGNYWRYFAAAAVLVVMVVIMVMCTGPDKRVAKVDDTQQGTNQVFTLADSFEQDAHEDVNALINSYFSAYASGDVATLETVAYPITDNEKSYINVCSQLFEAYQNVSCYTKPGLTSGSYFVSTYYELKFYGVDTAAPGLAFFYVETDADGKLYVNNSFCAYNRERMETEMDGAVYAVYVQYGQQPDVTALREDVQSKYQGALNSDSNLVTMLSSTFPSAVDTWRQTIVADSGAVEGAPVDDAQQGDAVTTETPDDENQQEVTDADPADQEVQASGSEAGVTAELKKEYGGQAPARQIKVVVTASSVNVRPSASTSGDSLGKATEGEEFARLGVEGDWSIIDYKGQYGYIKTEFLSMKE